jgi:hypothetical protein
MIRLFVYGIVTLAIGAQAWAAGNNALHQHLELGSYLSHFVI